MQGTSYETLGFWGAFFTVTAATAIAAARSGRPARTVMLGTAGLLVALAGYIIMWQDSVNTELNEAYTEGYDIVLSPMEQLAGYTNVMIMASVALMIVALILIVATLLIDGLYSGRSAAVSQMRGSNPNSVLADQVARQSELNAQQRPIAQSSVGSWGSGPGLGGSRQLRQPPVGDGGE